MGVTGHNWGCDMFGGVGGGWVGGRVGVSGQ